MAKFCGHCGSRLDETTGLCPICDQEKLQQMQVESVAARHSGGGRPGRFQRILPSLLVITAVLAVLILLVVASLPEQQDPAEAEDASHQEKSAGSDLVLDNSDIESADIENTTSDEDLIEDDVVTIDAQNTYIEAFVSDDGDAYLSIPEDGSVITIDKDASVHYAMMTPDREHIVVLLTRGTLYLTDRDQSYQTILAEDVDKIYDIRNDGVIYRQTNMQFNRASFADGSIVEDIGSNYALAPNSIRMLYDQAWTTLESRPNGNTKQYVRHYALYSVDPDSDESIILDSKVGGEVLGISDDGVVAAWRHRSFNASGSKTKYTLYYYEDGQLTQFDAGYDDTGVGWQYARDQRLNVVWQEIKRDANNREIKLWLKRRGGEFIETDAIYAMGQETSYEFYTEHGPLCDVDGRNVSALYLAVDEGDYYTEDTDRSSESLYYISMDGHCEKMLENIVDVQIANGNIMYIAADSGLYTGELEGSTIHNETPVSYSNNAHLTDNGEYVYFEAISQVNGRGFYCNRVGTDTSGLVVQSGVRNAYYSEDGTTVVLVREYKYADDPYGVDPDELDGEDLAEYEDWDNGRYTLMCWSVGADAPVVIGKIRDYISSDAEPVITGMDHQRINPQGFSYLTSPTTDLQGEVYNLMYYNGTESVLCGENLRDMSDRGLGDW